MTSDQLSAAAGVALSLAFSYVPGLRDRFAALSGEHKRIGMLAALLIVTLGSFGLTCGGLLGSTAIQCNRAGAIDLLWAFCMGAEATGRPVTGRPGIPRSRSWPRARTWEPRRCWTPAICVCESPSLQHQPAQERG